MLIVRMVLVLLVHVQISEGLGKHLISEAAEQLKLKGKTVIVAEVDDHVEYPGNNYENLQIIRKRWENYYDCLAQKFEQQREGKPTIVQIVEGQHTSLKCPFCPRPFREYENLEWRYKPLSSDVNDPEEPEILDLSHQMRFSRKMSLKIYNAISGYSGLYACYYRNNTISVYILEVVGSENMTLLRERPVSNDTVALTDGKELEVYYLWSKWTKCSTCDSVGRQYTYGICMAKIKDSNADSQSNQYLPSTRKSKNVRKYARRAHRKRKATMLPPSSLDEMELAREIISKFQTGIPCSSKLMPTPFVTIIQQLNRSTASVLFDYCKEPCPESRIVDVVNNKGQLVEEVNNSAGIYSSFQAIPTALPDVERKTITQNFGEDVTIQCPGNLKSDIPITWMINNLLLIPELIANESLGRVYIDFVNKLHIGRLRQGDDQIYSCWQHGKLAGAVSLHVAKKLKFAFNHHVMLVSMLFVALTFVYIGFKVLSRELLMRKKAKLTT